MAQKKKQKCSKQFNNLQTCVQDLARTPLPEVSILSEEERAEMQRPRGGFQKATVHVAALSRDAGVVINAHDMGTVDADCQRIAELEKLRDTLDDGVVPFLRAVDDSLLQARSALWTKFLAYYGVLAKMAEADPLLAARLKPVVEFMANGKRAKPTDSGKAANDDDDGPVKKEEDVA